MPEIDEPRKLSRLGPQRRIAECSECGSGVPCHLIVSADRHDNITTLVPVYCPVACDNVCEWVIVRDYTVDPDPGEEEWSL